MAASSGNKAMQIPADAAKIEGLAIDVLTNLVKDARARKGIFKKVVSMVRNRRFRGSLLGLLRKKWLHRVAASPTSTLTLAPHRG